MNSHVDTAKNISFKTDTRLSNQSIELIKELCRLDMYVRILILTEDNNERNKSSSDCVNANRVNNVSK